MLKKLATHARLERRRLFIVTTFAFAAGVFFYGNAQVAIHGAPAPLVAGMLYAMLIGPAALVTTIVLPAARFLIEGIAVSRLGVAVTAFSFPEIGLALLSYPLLMTAVVVAGGSLVSRALHGRIKRPRRHKLAWWTTRRRARVAAAGWQADYIRWVDLHEPVRV